LGRKLNVLAALPELVAGSIVSGTVLGATPWTVIVTLPVIAGVSRKGGATVAPTVHDEQIPAWTGPARVVVVVNPPDTWVCRPGPMPPAPAAPACRTVATTPNARADSMNAFVALAPRRTT
jgi:hypothetical protein